MPKPTSSTYQSDRDSFQEGPGQLLGLDCEGTEAPETRLADAKSAYSIFVKFLEADAISAHNRRILQGVVDGEAPLKDSILRATGQGYRFNLNFLEGDTQMQAALTGLNDLIDSVDVLARLRLPLNVLTPEERTDVEEVIEEELDTLIRDWPQFDAHWQILCREFMGFGVGFATHLDERTWKFKPGGWDDYLMPRQTTATEEEVEVLIGRKQYGVHELWKAIRNFKDGEDAGGWDVTEVRKAIVTACKGPQRKTWQRFWPGIEKELKNNDLATSFAEATEVSCLHFWVREFDGSYSFFITLADGTNADFLYKRLSRFDCATDAFTIFAFGVGNGTYHSIRGLIWKMFPFIQASNRLRCQMLDSTLLSMSLLVQAMDEENQEDLALTIAGPVAYLPAGAQIVERGLPNVATNALPVVQDLSSAFTHATGQYRPLSGEGAGTEKTAEEYRGNAEQQATLTTATVNMFYRSWRRLLASIWKRIVAIGPNNGEFPEIKDFYLRCEQRGVPQDIVKKIARVTPVRAIGHGSPQARQLAFNELTQMLGQLDETGRANAIRDRIAHRFGREAADRYAPKVQRVAPEVKVAALENLAMKLGDLPVLPDETHAVHLSIHFPALMELTQNIDEQMGQNAPIQSLAPDIEQASRLLKHSGDHLNMLAADETRKDQIKEMTRGLQQATGILNSAMNELQSQQQEQAQQPQQAPPPEQQASAAKLQFAEAQHQQKMQHREEDFTQKQQQRHVVADTKLAEHIQQQTVKQGGLPTLNRAA